MLLEAECLWCAKCHQLVIVGRTKHVAGRHDTLPIECGHWYANLPADHSPYWLPVRLTVEEIQKR